MFKIFLSSLFVLTVIITNHMIEASIKTPFLLKPAAYANNPCGDIRNGQFVCLDCATLAYCMQEGGDWITMEIATCATERSMYCNEDAKSCALQRECFVPSYGIRFECQNPGKYPDPYDCKTYHICSSLNEDTRIVCPSGSIYSVGSKDCIQRTTDSDVCRQAQYRCDRPGMMGAWPGDPNIYYVCHVKRIDGEFVYYPLLYRCQAGKVFNGESCVANSNPKPPPAKQSASTIN